VQKAASFWVLVPKRTHILLLILAAPSFASPIHAELIFHPRKACVSVLVDKDAAELCLSPYYAGAFARY